MSKDKFVIVSMQEDKAKQLAQVISNVSCRKILDYLTEHEATETDLSKKLNIPISTVHYNLKQLMGGGLIVADEFHYSTKGKEVNHYKLANQFIIIAPKSTTYGMKERLRALIAVVVIISGVGLIIQYVNKQPTLMDAAPMMAQKSMAMVEEATITQQAMPIMQQTLSNGWWFIFGGIIALLLLLLIERIRKK